MSKAQTNQCTHPIPALGPQQGPSLLQQAIQVFTMLSLFLVVMTPITYFNGRAFHDGWYDYFHLDQSMFPLDTAGMLTDGAVAWGDALAQLTHAANDVFRLHWFLLLLVALMGGLTWSVSARISDRLEDKRAKQKDKPAQHGRSPRRALITSIAARTLLILISFFCLYELILGLTLGFAVSVLPFYRLGGHEAKLAAANNFNKSPVVIVKSPKGDSLERKEIGCGPQFCALWGNGHASTAPLSAITWSESPPPDDPSANMVHNTPAAPTSPGAGSSR